jgi:pyruvate/2-oxoglutarate dehydrogenase complex dihydrolipoamide dehydrogenase (E3) component
LPKEDRDASKLVQTQMEKDGVNIRFNTAISKFEKLEEKWEGGFNKTRVHLKDGHIDADVVMFAIGRKPNVKGLNLEVAGVEYNLNTGLKVTKTLKTTNGDVYGVGECCTPAQFTHNSDICAKYVIRNSLFFGSQDYSKINLPWCTYTSPEVAHVGKYPEQLEAEGVEFDTYEKGFNKLDRALCDS